MNSLHKQVKEIKSRDDFADFVQELLEQYQKNPDAWGRNVTLEAFLEAISSATYGIPGIYANQNEIFPKKPTWRMLGEILWMATDYE